MYAVECAFFTEEQSVKVACQPKPHCGRERAGFAIHSRMGGVSIGRREGGIVELRTEEREGTAAA